MSRNALPLVFLLTTGVASSAAALDLANTPRLSEARKAKVLENYANAPKTCQRSYTVAVSESGLWSSYCHSGISRKEVARVTLETCQHVSGEDCGIVIQRGRAVAYQDATTQIKYPQVFDWRSVPFLSDRSRKRLRKYGRRDNNRALAITRYGAYWYVSGAGSKDEAKQSALQGCEKADGNHGRCFIYSIDADVAFDMFTDIFPDR